MASEEQRQTSMVVTQLNTKLESGQRYNPIGTDIRYISNRRNPSNGNLEEDMILGVNRVIEIENDDVEQAIKKTIKYCTPDKVDVGGYYELEIYLYGSQSGDSTVDINFDNDDLFFTVFGSEGSIYFPKADPRIAGNIISFDSFDYYYSDDTDLPESGSNGGFHQRRKLENMIYDEEHNKLLFLPTYLTEKSILYYRVDENNRIEISTKTIEEHFNEEGKHYITEIITQASNNG